MSQELALHKPTNMESAILEIVKRDDISPERLEKFLDLQVKMQDRQNKETFQAAMAKFQGKCPVIKQTSKVAYNSTNYSYAALDEIVHVIKPILSEFGLSFSFNMEEIGNKTKLTTTVYHADGHSQDSFYTYDSLDDGGKMNTSQKRKSALTYAKRAGIENSFGIVTAGQDDDARRCIDNPITDDQIVIIVDYSKNTQTTPEALLAHLNVSSLDDLTFDEAKKAITALKHKRKILLDRKKQEDGKVEF